MRIVDTTLNILTVGGHARAQEAYNEYKTCYEEYEKVFKHAQSKQKEIEHKTKQVGVAIESIVETLKQTNQILEIYEESMPLSLKEEQYCKDVVSNVNKLVENYSSALSLAASGTIGATTAVGAWYLVSAIGLASTETAIGSLSGIAAYNATLAWFGGGSLATGGLGMVGGAVAVSGLFLVPFLAFGSWQTRKKASNLHNEKLKIEESKNSLLKQIVEMDKAIQLIQNRYIQINELHDSYKNKMKNLILSIGEGTKEFLENLQLVDVADNYKDAQCDSKVKKDLPILSFTQEVKKTSKGHISYIENPAQAAESRIKELLQKNNL